MRVRGWEQLIEPNESNDRFDGWFNGLGDSCGISSDQLSLQFKLSVLRSNSYAPSIEVSNA